MACLVLFCHECCDTESDMPKTQVRLTKDVVAAASTERSALGFDEKEPLGNVLSALARDGIEYRRMQQRERARAATYAAWADDDELHADVRETFGWTVQSRVR